MEIFVTGLHIGLCFFLLLIVLLQPGKGADFGAAMGGSSQGGEIFGATGSVSLLTKITALAAALFMGTSLTLAWFSNAPATGRDLSPDALENQIGAGAVDEGAAKKAEEAEAPGSETAAPADEASPVEGAAAAPVDEAAPADSAAPSQDGNEGPGEATGEAGEPTPAAEGSTAPAEGE